MGCASGCDMSRISVGGDASGVGIVGTCAVICIIGGCGVVCNLGGAQIWMQGSTLTRGVGTLGTYAVVCILRGCDVVCTLGGARIWMRGSTLGDGTGSRSLGVSAGAAVLKISASLWSARICLLPRYGRGEASTGFISASVSNLAASVDLSPEELCGILMLCGKNSTVRAIFSDLVFVMYIV